MNSYPWFKHDKCASFDERIGALLAKEGAKGYGTYWYIIEKISMQSHQKISFLYLNSIRRKGFTSTYMKKVITDYGLFNVEGDCFSSVIPYSKSSDDGSTTHKGNTHPDRNHTANKDSPESKTVARTDQHSAKDLNNRIAENVNECASETSNSQITENVNEPFTESPNAPFTKGEDSCFTKAINSSCEDKQKACLTAKDTSEATGNVPEIAEEPIEENVECIKHYVYATLRKGELYLNGHWPENEADRRTYYLFSMQKVLLELSKDLRVFNWFLRWNWVNDAPEMNGYLAKKRLKLNGYWPKNEQKLNQYSTNFERKPDEFSTKTAPETMPEGGFLLTLISFEDKHLRSSERVKHIYLYEINTRVLRIDKIRIDKMRINKIATAEKEEEKERDSAAVDDDIFVDVAVASDTGSATDVVTGISPVIAGNVVDADVIADNEAVADEYYKNGKAFINSAPPLRNGTAAIASREHPPRKSGQQKSLIRETNIINRGNKRH